MRQATTHSPQIRMVLFPAPRDRQHRPGLAYLVTTNDKDSSLRQATDFPVSAIFQMTRHPPFPPETKALTGLPPFADRPVSTGGSLDVRWNV